jgi:tetratricopeptide (TPR) repeat protein
VVYLLQGRYSDAIPQFQRSVAIYPSPDAYSNLGVSYFFQGNFQEAAHNYEKALQVGSNDSSAYLIWGNLGEAYYWTGDRARSAEAYEKAIALAKDRLKVNIRDADVLVHIGLYNAMLQEKATAEEYVDKAMQQAPQDTNVRFNAAKALVELGEGKKAFPLLEKAVAAGYSKPFVRDDPAFKVVATDVQFQHILQGK